MSTTDHNKVLALTAFFLLGPLLSGCVQDTVVVERSNVAGRIRIPQGFSAVGIRANIVGTGTNLNRIELLGPAPGSSELGFSDVEGDFSIETKVLGRHYVVARGVNYDIGFGTVVVPRFTDTFTVSELDSASIPPNDPRLTDGFNDLVPKTPGQAVFLVFKADFGDFQSADIVGDFNNFDPADGVIAVHDDGSQFDVDETQPGTQVSGDRVAGDGVFTRVSSDARFAEFAGDGGMKYGIIINKDERVRRDPYEEKSSRGRSVILIR